MSRHHRKPRRAARKSKKQGPLLASTSATPILVVTGQPRKQRILVYLCNTACPLTPTAYLKLIDLVHARCVNPKGTGFSKLPSLAGNGSYLAICRLREQIDEALGEGAGFRLIEGAWCGYRLTVRPDEIAIDPTFTERSDVISPSVLADLAPFATTSQ